MYQHVRFTKMSHLRIIEEFIECNVLILPFVNFPFYIVISYFPSYICIVLLVRIDNYCKTWYNYQEILNRDSAATVKQTP